MDNFSWKNNIRICGLKEYVEGKDLAVFLEEHFEGLSGSEAEFVISILFAHRVGPCNKSRKTPRGIVVKFSDWETKLYVLRLLRQESSVKYWRFSSNSFL